MKITRLDPIRHQLGEGPLWDVAEQALYGADVLGRLVWRLDPVSGDERSWPIGDLVSALALCREGGAIIARSKGLYHLDFTSGQQRPLASPLPQGSANLLNDGKVDRAGRFIFGSVNPAALPADAAYWRYSGGALALLDDGYQVTNGPCWSPDSRIFYAADSVRNQIYAYDYDLASGAATNRRVFADFADAGGIADGATVDAEGCLWVAVCGGGKLIRLRPDGTKERSIELPTPLTSSVMFGGPALDRLFVTSINGEAAAREIPMAAANPTPADDNAGALFVIDGLGIRGLPETRFAG